jgi:hypothetical protein
MRWRRLRATLASGFLRDEGGRLLEWPAITVGERCVLLSEPLVPPLIRQVQTSRVVVVLERESRMPENGSHRAPRSFRQLQVGDAVTRMLAGSIPMRLVVTAIEGEIIRCGAWTFDGEGGFEVDEDLGWGPKTGITGSFIVVNAPSTRAVDW